MVNETDAEALLLIEANREWFDDKTKNNWELPGKANFFLRLPIIRHIRTIWHSILIDRHNRFWRSLGMIPTGYDHWVLYAMWRGWI